jgi:hypothetical protein
VSILLYFLGGWVLLNILFAVGMFFRPRRRRSVGSPSGPAAARARETDGSGASPRQPAMLERLLLFGLWLGDNRRSG